MRISYFIFLVFVLFFQISCEEKNVAGMLYEPVNFLLEKSRDIDYKCKMQGSMSLPLNKREKLPFICDYLYRNLRKQTELRHLTDKKFYREIRLILDHHEKAFGDRLYPFIHLEGPINSRLKNFISYLEENGNDIKKAYKKHGFDLVSAYIVLCDIKIATAIIDNNIGYEKEYWDKKGFTPSEYLDETCEKGY